MQDWRDSAASEQRSAAVRALAKKYKVRVEDAVEHVVEPTGEGAAK